MLVYSGVPGGAPTRGVTRCILVRVESCREAGLGVDSPVVGDEVPASDSVGGDTALAALLSRVRALDASDLERVGRAYEVSRRAHSGQMRASGDAYISHPLAVATILADLGMDGSTIIGGLLHDVIEDTPLTLDDVRSLFGEEIALLVDGVTKLSKLTSRSRAEAQAENFRKMFLAMAHDIRVVLIKLADRLHNMRTLDSLDEARQRRTAEETLEIFAPLAHRLGIFRVKWELEDLALRYLEPEAYRDLARKIPQRRMERERYAEVLMKELGEHLAEVGIDAEISGRAKNFYSIYQKLYKQGKDINQLYDLIAVRVIVETIKDCYGVLGVVHTVWKPVPGRFKDYIAMPKSNLYQSLHTTVIGPQGEPFEIQIRTREMHRTAEYGIAAHWRYKEGHTDRDFDRRLGWLREILDGQRDKDAHEFMDSLKSDMFADEVFVFTPRGDVLELPAGSTPIDFAYRVHSEVGHHCIGAKVNGKIASLESALHNGDIVEIITNNSGTPSPGWLTIVRTGLAKNRIRQFLKKERRDEALALGRTSLQREAKRQGLDPVEALRTEALAPVAARFSFTDVDDLLVGVGFGGLSSAQVIGRVREILRRKEASKPHGEDDSLPIALKGTGGSTSSGGVVVKGMQNILVRFSRCCHPVPGDPIVGYVTRGRGVSIHHPDCPNIQAHRGEDGRIIEVNWDAVATAAFPVELEISAYDRPGLLSDIAQIVANAHSNILFASARGDVPAGRALIDLVVEVKDLADYEGIRRKILKVPDVLSAERTIRAKGMHGQGVRALG